MNRLLLASKEYNALDWNSWGARHNDDVRLKYGVWRWRGMYDNRDKIVLEISDMEKYVLDFGGAMAPLGFNSVIVDKKNASEEFPGRGTLLNSLDYIPDEIVHVIFSSHTLEHIIRIRMTIRKMWRILHTGGKVIIHVPAISGRQYWHPSIKPEHRWLFALKGDTIQDIKREIPIDVLLEQMGFEIELAKHVGDCSILIVGRKK